MYFSAESAEISRFKRNDYVYFVIKGLLFLLLFAVVHQIYKWSPTDLKPYAALISEVNESLYQHFKMGFVIWIMLLVLELLVFRKNIEDKNQFIFSRLATILVLSWITFTFWNILPGITLNFTPSVEIELLWSFLATFLAGCTGAIFDFIFFRIKFNIETKLIIGVLLIIMYLQFIVYSFTNPPEWLFFQGPPE